MFLQLIHVTKIYKYNPIFKAYAMYNGDIGHK